MVIKFWGTRGSIPVPGKDTLVFGGNTPCVEIRFENDFIILDGGSGIRQLGNHLINKYKGRDIHIFLSHYHWDHIQGIPFFKPLYDKNYTIYFYGFSADNYSIENLLSSQMRHQNFPISMDSVSASIKYRDVYPNNSLRFEGLEIETFLANHPSTTLIYKFRNRGKSVVYMTDNELDFEVAENSVEYSRLVDFCFGCDYLIHDSMFDLKSEKKSKGWGHSSNISLVKFAIDSGVRNIVMFHYNPDYTDEKIEILLEEARSFLKAQNSGINCIPSMEGMEIIL